MNFDLTPEFRKDFKRLSKRWKSLNGDIEAAKKYILPLYECKAGDIEISVYRDGFFRGKRAAVLKTTSRGEVIKMRLDVADLGRNDKVRVVFVAIIKNNTIKFIELYAKNDKEREDSARIKKYLPS